jgi:4-hydroxy-tetrahydrodipicolinate synthase
VGQETAVISGVSSESITEAVEHAEEAERVGADGVLLMPPHFWLRFGMTDDHVLAYYQAVANAITIPIVCHVYPAWTKASYSPSLLGKLAALDGVTTFKVGTRDMSRYDRDIRAIREADPAASILTCHDEYLLPSLAQGVDGALVGFASLVPELVTELVAVVEKGDLVRARELHWQLFELKEAVYGAGEPSAEAHARMKTAMMLAGRLPSDLMRPPTGKPSEEARGRIARALEAAGVIAPGATRIDR